jgi:predicted nuclease of predicted toxin-antitoxin system
MTISLLANENFPVPAVRKLRAAGIDVVAVTDVMPAAADTEVLALARQQGRWIVTFDRDYGELVFKNGLPAPPAILYLRQEPYPADRPADLVLAMISEPKLAEGFLVVISERGVRRKRFPDLAGG